MKNFYKLQRKIIFVAALALILQIIAPVVGSYSFAEELEKKQGFVLELVNVTDLENEPFNDENLLQPDSEFRLNLDWNLKNNHNYINGDKVEFDLPQGINIQEEMNIEFKYGELTVADVVIKMNGTVELTFTDFVETHSNIEGYMQIIAKIDEENAEVEDGEIILRPIGDEGTIRIPIDLGEREKTIEKKGTPNKSYNADEIKWSVTINKLRKNLKSVIVKDILPGGTQYKEESIKLTKLKVDLNGNILGDLEEVNITGETVQDGILNIPLGDIKDAYRIEYVTIVTDDEQKTFQNNVTLSDNELDDISANATITINRGQPIKKSAVTAYNPKTGIIKWEIKFNFNQKDLDNVILKDVWTPKGQMHLVEDSLKFQEVTIDENGITQNVGEPIDFPEGAGFINGEDQFEVTGITTNKAYIVTYHTKVNDRVLEGFSISNTAGFGTETSGSGRYVGAWYGSKSSGDVDYENKTVAWTIELNHDEYPMKKISILDTLGNGLSLIKDSVEITVGGVLADNYTVSDGNPFTIKFPDEYTTSEKIIIKYKTKFVANEVTDYLAKNKADLTWTPGGGGDSITKEVKAETPLNTETEDNSWKNGSYNPETKEITWTIFTNYRENQIDNLIVKDLPQGNQKIIEGSARVTELKILAGGNTEDVNTLDGISTINTVDNSLTVNIGNTNKAYRIEYKTSLAGLGDIQKEYFNQAEVFDGGESLSTTQAKVDIVKAHTYAEKSGKQDGKQIHWAITVNPGQQRVTNLKLLDTVSSNQDILSGTLEVYEASVDINGEATKGEKLSNDNYTLSHTEGELEFTIA